MADTSDSGSSFNKEGIGNVLTVAIVLCLVCSIIVAGAAVNLRPAQQLNRPCA